MMKKLLMLTVLGGSAWAAWHNRDDLQRYLRIRGM